ncbi:MAG: efflux RND transporter periplasmic adaptor subunit [Deltaproteobacteria bacterium]|nr:efflux RND transporter periplasmic adaptor subunit [Deltaproteobacteria bacterium]
MTAAICTTLAMSGGCGDSAPETQAEDSPQTEPTRDVVVLSPEAISRNGIQLAQATNHPISDLVEAPAEVQLDPDRVAHVSPLVPGQLRRVDFSIGAQVQRGQQLAVLRSVELGQARAEQRRARAMLEVAEANFARQQRLRSDGISSQRSFLEAQLRRAEAVAQRDAARARLLVFGLHGGRGPDMPIVAPIGGTIIERHATQGENVAADDVLFVIADTAKVWVVGRAYERDMPKLRLGAHARLTLQSQPERSWEGTVSFLAPVVDETTRTLAVRTELDNDDGTLRPGLFGRLQISVGEPQLVVTVPQVAVQQLRGDAVVFVPGDEANSFRAQRVTTGRRTGELVEIRSGLEAGSQVVVAGAFLLKSQLMTSEFGEEE